ncbi:MAG: hypothetical protein Q7T79_00290 [bacterium]|nr:hypothetical protein [bacterium]
MSYKLQNDKNRIEKLKKAIINVIVFFDMFNYPLTLSEIWQFLSIKCELVEVFDILENGIDEISLRNGFYFLFGKEKNIIERLARYNFADRKFKRAIFITKIYKFIPWIEMIGMTNLFGARNLKDNSDIDLFIITSDKRIWLTRFLCVGIIKLLGWRPQTNNRRDKICLSFYVSLSSLNLEKLRLGQNDLGFTYWLAGLTPLYNVDGAYQKLIDANQWLTASLPNKKTEAKLQKASQSNFLLPRTPGTGEVLGMRVLNRLEQQSKVLQLKILPQKLKNMMNCDSRVVINDQMIKLHSNDRREEYIKNYELRITNCLNH